MAICEAFDTKSLATALQHILFKYTTEDLTYIPSSYKCKSDILLFCLRLKEIATVDIAQQLFTEQPAGYKNISLQHPTEKTGVIVTPYATMLWPHAVRF